MNKLAILALSLLTCLVLSPVGEAGTTQTSAKHGVKMSSFSLSSQKWKNRVLLVFAPSSSHRTYQQQMQLFEQHQRDFANRDLVLVQVLAQGPSYANGEPIDSSTVAHLRDRFGVSKEDFRVVLVGKDGGTKRSDSSPVKANTIFGEIDAMPMRQQEMRERSNQH